MDLDAISHEEITERRAKDRHLRKALLWGREGKKGAN